MSDAFEPSQEFPEYLPEQFPSNKNHSPWLLGCGALLLALGALVVLAAVGFGVVWFALRPTAGSTGIRAAGSIRIHRGPSVAERRLPDGSLLVLEQVTYGRLHRFDFGIDAPPGQALASPVSHPDGRTVHTHQNMIVVWFTKWDSKKKAQDFDWFLRCAAVDAHGCEVDNIDKGRFAVKRGGSSSEHGGTGPFSRLGGGPHDMIATHFGLPPFRHDGETFKLRVYDTAKKKIAEFDVRDPSPMCGKYPEWEPEPLPITQSDGDVSLTLAGLTAQSSESTRTVNGIPQTETRVRLNTQFLTNQAGEPTGNWSVRSSRLYDAMGNESSTYDCDLCPKESAWQLEVRLWRRDSAPFDASEIWSVPELSVPESQRAEYVNEAKAWEGTTLELVAVGGAGTVSYPGLPNEHSGRYSTGGSSYFGQGNNRRRVRYKIKVDNNQTTVESEVPYLLVRATDLTRDHRFTARVRGPEGEELPLDGPRSYAASLYFWFIDVPENINTLNAEFIVHQCRTFDFLVAPPKIEPAPPSRPSRSPRSPAQRLASTRQAIENGKRALASSPENAEVLNNLAWAYATAPEALRDAKQAVALAEKAVALQPENRNYLNTLGVAYYRAGQYDKAISTLERKAGERSDAAVAFDLYALAMAYFKLDQADKAKETYNRAFDRHRRPGVNLSSNHWQELYEFRVEAATLFLGEPPQQVFDRAKKLAREGDWEPAAAEFAKGLDVYPDDHWNSYRSGALHAYLDRPEEFRNDCRRMLDLFGDTEDPFIAERTGKLSLLLPGAVPRDSRASQLCDKAAAMRPENAWFQLASAISKYRAVQFADAFDRLQVAEAQAGEQVYCRVLIDLFQAMSLHHLGQREAAQDSLKNAIDRLNATAPKAKDEVMDYGSGWHDRLMSEVIRREAEALVRASPPSQDCD